MRVMPHGTYVFPVFGERAQPANKLYLYQSIPGVGHVAIDDSSFPPKFSTLKIELIASVIEKNAELVHRTGRDAVPNQYLIFEIKDGLLSARIEDAQKVAHDWYLTRPEAYDAGSPERNRQKVRGFVETAYRMAKEAQNNR